MTITIFKDKNCKGREQTVSGNIRDLKDHPADKPGSIRMTSAREAVVMFKNDDWHGGALYIRGPKTVENLGSAKEGGRTGFGNSIRSIRVTPFSLDLNVTVVTNGPNHMPAGWTTRSTAQKHVHQVIHEVQDFFDEQRALLSLRLARIEFRDDPDHFKLSRIDRWRFPAQWRRSGEVDVVFVDRFRSTGTSGYAKFPCFGDTPSSPRRSRSPVRWAWVTGPPTAGPAT